MRSLRHIASINDLSNEEIGAVFELALKYLEELGDPQIPHRIAQEHAKPRAA